MQFQIDSNTFWFIVSVIASILIIIGLMYVILILQRGFNMMKKIEEDLPILLREVKMVSASASKIAYTVSENTTELDSTIKSVANISGDVSHITNSVSNTAQNIEAVCDNTKQFSSKLNTITGLVSNAIKAVNTKNEVEEEAMEPINEQPKTYEIKDVKIEVNNE